MSLFKWHFFFISRSAKHIHCAQNVKTARLCTKFNKSINNIFSDMPHIVAFPRWPPLTLRVPHGSKIETCSDFSENSFKLFVFVIRISKMYSLMHLRCLLFKVHKIIGQRSFQIYTGVKSKIAPILMKHTSNCLHQHRDLEKNSFVYLRYFDSDLWPVNPFIHTVYVWNYLYIHLMGQRSTNQHLRHTKTILSPNLCVST